MNIKSKHFNLMLALSWDRKAIILLECARVNDVRYVNVHYVNLYIKGWGFRHSLFYNRRFVSITNFAKGIKAKRFRRKDE